MRYSRFERGTADPLLVPLIICILVILGLTGFGLWSYMQFTDHRDNVDGKVQAAVAAANEEQKKQLEAEFLEREKKPLRRYTGPRDFGSLSIGYPKTWSVFIVEGKGDSIEGFFHPGHVRSENTKTAEALRFSVVSADYSEELQDYDDNIEDRTLRAKPIKIAGTIGTRLDGTLEDEQVGTMVIFKVRDKTLRVWTESTEYRNDFEKIILKNLKFSP